MPLPFATKLKIQPWHFPFFEAATPRPVAVMATHTWKEIEEAAIARALAEAAGDKRAAAEMLGIGKTTLYRKLQMYKAGWRAGSLRRSGTVS